MDFIEELLEAPYKSADKKESKHGTSASGGSPAESSNNWVTRDTDHGLNSDNRNGGHSRERSADKYRERDRHKGFDRDRNRARERDRDGYRGSGHRKRSPERRDDYYRSRDDHRGRRERDDRNRSATYRPRSPPLSGEERDKRTIFVQQLAARLRTRELIEFFSKAGAVRDAQIVKDRVTGRSKGVGYVEFRNEDSVPIAVNMTGQRLLGIPIIAQLTEAEKNRLAHQEMNGGVPETVSEATSTSLAGNASEHFTRLYVGNIHPSITEDDIRALFEPFGDAEFVQLQRDGNGESSGTGVVQFHDPTHAKDALEQLDGYDLGGRRMLVSSVKNDKTSRHEARAQLSRYYNESPRLRSRSPVERRKSNDRNGHDRARSDRRDLDRHDARAQREPREAPDRFALMRKLSRTHPEDRLAPQKTKALEPSCCVLLKNMFNPAEESGDNWTIELEDDVRAECNEKYGRVKHLSLDPSPQGEIYVKFDSVSGGVRAVDGLNGRFFGGRTIEATYILEAIYHSRFPRAKNL